MPVAAWTDPRHRLGVRGERVALEYLIACGWDIEAHRFRLGRHDVDLVARRGSLVAFVEVKTRRGSAFGETVESVGSGKRRILARVAECWRARYGRRGDVYRFDLIGLRPGPAGLVVEHVADAWRL